jgi:hypothetical protein
VAGRLALQRLDNIAGNIPDQKLGHIACYHMIASDATARCTFLAMATLPNSPVWRHGEGLATVEGGRRT